MSFRSLLSRDGLSRLVELPPVSMLAWMVFPVLFILMFGDELADVYKRPLGLALAYVSIAAIVMALNWDSIWSAIRLRFRSVPSLHWGWALVGFAVALRIFLLEFLPPDVPINIEELQLGRDSILAVLGHDLAVPYRFTILMGAAGFQIADNTLDGLRLVYKVAGCLSIVVIAAALRRLAVGWPATLLAVFTMSSLSLFVVGSAVAYENFSALFFEAMLLYCAIGASTSRTNSLVWAAFAGMFAGILLHEWISYQPPVALPLLFWLAQAVFTKNAECRRVALRSGGVYVALLTLTGAPALLELVTNPSNSVLLDPLFRHWWEREATSPDIARYLRNSGVLVWSYATAMSGQNAPLASAQFRLDGGGVIPLMPGALFALSALYALAGRAGMFASTAAAALVIMLLAAGFLANNFLVERVASALPILILLSGVCVDSVVRRLQSGEATSNPLRKNPLVYLTLLTGAIVLVNVNGTVRMSSNEAVLREYQNNQYVVCLTIAAERREFEFSYVHLYADGACNKGDDLWLYPDMTADIHNAQALPQAGDLEPGTLVVLGRVHGLDEGRLAELTSLAWQTGSSHTLRTGDNLMGDVATMSFCYECGGTDGKME